MEHEYMRTHYGEKYWDKLCGKPMPEESTPPIWKENYLLQQQYIEELEHELNVANQRIDMLTACNADVARIAKERDDTLKRIKRLEEFANRFLNPDDLGWAIGKHDRDEAREALGKERVESK